MSRKRKRRYKPRVPLVVSGGIKAQSAQHGGSRRAWWVQRWYEMLESFGLGARLGRGRGYAAAGQVSELEIVPGEVVGVVQGMSEEPYTSRISCRQVTAVERSKILGHLRSMPMQIGRILAGDLPVEVEEYFNDAGVPLFFGGREDVKTECSCPDWGNPCKHLVAVYYLLGEAVAHKPLLLLELRGVGREWLVEPDTGDASGGEHSVFSVQCSEHTACRVDMEGDGTGALSGGGSPDAQAHLGTVRPTSQLAATPAYQQGVVAPLVQRLGPFPFWRGQERFMERMSDLYTRAARKGLDVWSGEAPDLRTEEERTIVHGANLRLRQSRLSIDSSLR